MMLDAIIAANPAAAAVADRPPLVMPDSPAFDRVKVTKVYHWNDTLFSFAVERPASFRFRAGEFVMIGLHIGGKPLMRAYSVAGPTWAEELEFFSIKVENGPLTQHLQGIRPGDEIYMGRKPTGTLVTDALVPGKRLFLLSTGTGLAPFLSIVREPDVYDLFDHIILVHSVRQSSELAFHRDLSARLADDPLVGERAVEQFHYIPTVTRDPAPVAGAHRRRIQALIEDGTLFADPVSGPKLFDAATDRAMMCGSMAMIRDFSDLFESMGFTEGSNATPGDFVIERAFVG